MPQPTQFQHVQTDSVSDASRLLDLDGLAVDRVESDAFGGRVVHVVTADETASACPSFGGVLGLAQGSGRQGRLVDYVKDRFDSGLAGW